MNMFRDFGADHHTDAYDPEFSVPGSRSCAQHLLLTVSLAWTQVRTMELVVIQEALCVAVYPLPPPNSYVEVLTLITPERNLISKQECYKCNVLR